MLMAVWYVPMMRSIFEMSMPNDFGDIDRSICSWRATQTCKRPVRALRASKPDRPVLEPCGMSRAV